MSVSRRAVECRGFTGVAVQSSTFYSIIFFFFCVARAINHSRSIMEYMEIIEVDLEPIEYEVIKVWPLNWPESDYEDDSNSDSEGKSFECGCALNFCFLLGVGKKNGFG